MNTSRTAFAAGIGVVVAVAASCGGSDDDSAAQQAALVEQGKQIFRFDTFGDELQWTDTLRMHEVIAASVDPTTALSVGPKVDADALPAAVVVDAAKKAAYSSWGKGKYDPRFNIDGTSKPVVIPPAYGLAGVPRITFTGDGNEIAYWNRYVAVTQMGGQGSFSEPRLNVSVTRGTQDLVSSKLAALQAYQLSLAAPAPPAGSFDAVAAARGKAVFEGAGQCSTCHSGSTFTDANSTLHPPSDSMAEPETPSYASRSATRQYRSTPLKGVWQNAPYFHDGSAATLNDAVQAYNTKRSLGLTPQQVADVVEYLKSL